MSWQPPVHSPLSLGALAGAAARWLGGRDRRPELEALLLEAYGADRVVLTASGTQALQLGIRSALTATGTSRVALPAFSCFDLVTAALGAGAEMVFYDVEPETLDPEPSSFRESLSSGGVGAAVVAPLFGRVAPWARLRAAARQAGVVLIEDAAQGVGSTWDGRPAGSIGELSVLSFGRGKGWTGGGGGALLLRRTAPGPEPALADPPPGARLLVKSAAQWLLARPTLYGLPSRIPWLGLGETRYDPPSPPAALSPFAAALALATRASALEAVEGRRAHARSLLREMGGEGAEPPPGWSEGCSYLRLPVRAPGGMEAFPDPSRARRMGILASYPWALPDLPAAREGSSRPVECPGARELARTLLTLPTHGMVGGALRARMAALVRSAGGKVVGSMA